MSVNGVSGNSNNPPVVGITSEGAPTVSSTSGSPETEPQSPLVNQNSPEENLPEGDIPAPDPNSTAYAAWAAQELERLEGQKGDLEQQKEDLERLREDLEVLAYGGNQDAQELLSQLNEAIDELDQRDEEIDQEIEGLQQWFDNHDLDPDDPASFNNPDFDGDGLTNAFEETIGTNPFSQDTDGDHIRDDAEIALQDGRVQLKEIAGWEWVDPNNPDANNNGVLDGDELPNQIALRRYRTDFEENSAPGGAGGNGGPGGANGPDGVGSQSEELLWTSTSESAQEVDTANGNQTISGDGPYHLTLNSDATFRKDGTSLVVETETGTITFENFFDEEGVPQRRIDIDGPGQIQFYNMNPSDIQGADTDGDGFADVGLHITSPDGEIDATYDPFNGEVPMVTNEEETVYDVTGVAGGVPFEIPETIDGQEVKQVFVTQDGDDIIVELKNEAGEVLRRFRLQGGADKIASYDIRFKLADNGQLFDATDLKVKVDGGTGDDMIKVGGGYADGGAGNDTLIAEVSDTSLAQATEFHGGAGNDILVGNVAEDQLYGDAGRDLLYSGLGVTTDYMNGGAGSDVIIGQVWNGGYIIDGAGGAADISNIDGANVEGIELGPSQGHAVIDRLEETLADEDTTEALRDKLEEARALADIGQTQGADAIRDTVLFYLDSKISSNEASYGIESGESLEDIVPPPGPGGGGGGGDDDDEPGGGGP